MTRLLRLLFLAASAALAALRMEPDRGARHPLAHTVSAELAAPAWPAARVTNDGARFVRLAPRSGDRSGASPSGDAIAIDSASPRTAHQRASAVVRARAQTHRAPALAFPYDATAPPVSAL